MSLVGDKNGIGIKFTPEIQLGHIIQAIVMIASMAGYALWAYSQIQNQIASQAAQLALVQQRLSTTEAATTELRNETRQTLSKILDQIGDLRTLVASQGRADATRR